DHADDARERRGAADAALLKRLDERRLGVARLGRGLVALRLGVCDIEHVALRDLRQLLVLVFVVLVALLVGALLVGLEEALEGVDGARRRELEALAVGLGRERDGRRLELRVAHLARDRALPDQLVHALLVAAELARDVLRRAEAVARRADRLVRLLRVLRLRRVHARLGGDRLVAVQRDGLRPRGLHGL